MPSRNTRLKDPSPPVNELMPPIPPTPPATGSDVAVTNNTATRTNSIPRVFICMQSPLRFSRLTVSGTCPTIPPGPPSPPFPPPGRRRQPQRRRGPPPPGSLEDRMQELPRPLVPRRREDLLRRPFLDDHAV